MALPNHITKTLRMKPEVEKIFEDLEKWHDHCRFNLLNFDPADLYRSQDYKYFSRPAWNGERKPRGEYSRAGGQNRNYQR
jgi:hypothetical protein